MDLVAELPSSKVVTTFINGGLDSTWRSLADITREAAPEVVEAAEAVGTTELFVCLIRGSELFVEFDKVRWSLVFKVGFDAAEEFGAMATFE